MSKYHGKFPLGAKFGRWTVTNPILEYNDKSRAKVNVQCDCGAFKQVYASHLLNGNSTSCGCSLTDRTGSNNPNYRGVGSVSGMKASEINTSCNATFSAGYLNTLASSQGYSCSVSGLPLHQTLTNGTVMLTGDSVWWYSGSAATFTVPANLPNTTVTWATWPAAPQQPAEWVHEDIAKMKGDFTDEYFIELCYRVVERNPRPTHIPQQKKPKPNSVIEEAQRIAKKYKK